jgi:dTDP-4-amino-4,6-dideoxygalactose transaminase
VTIPLLDLPALHAEIQTELDEAWLQVSRSGRFIAGDCVDRFEHNWARYCGTTQCVGVASGTAALQLTLSALGIGPGDEVIVPTNTFFATVEAVLAVGALPVFVDVDPLTLLMTTNEVEHAITHRSAAIIPVHLYGQPVDMESMNKLADAFHLAVIEDASQAHGATWKGRRVGGLGHAGCFSFYPSKNLGAFGDGGAVVTNDPLLAEKIRSLANHGRSQTEPYRHICVGGNHRLDELQAAILTVKLSRLETWNIRRRCVVEWYRDLLDDLPVEMVREAQDACSSWHLAVIQSDDRDDLRRHLAAAGIETSIHYPIPCHLQPALSAKSQRTLPVAESAVRRIMTLPMGPHLTRDHTIRIVDAIRATLKELHRKARKDMGKLERVN